MNTAALSMNTAALSMNTEEEPSMQPSQQHPLYVQVHPADNVAIIVNEGGLPAGTRFDSGLVLTESVPEAHKVALTDIPSGEAVIRYGVPIGQAEQDVARGSWVHEGILTLLQMPELDHLPLATNSPVAKEPLEGFTFEGFLNDDGSVGTRNILGISTTVQCVAATVDYAVKKIKSELLPKYPNVDDVVAITHNYGCGIAIDASTSPAAATRPSPTTGACTTSSPSSIHPPSPDPVVNRPLCWVRDVQMLFPKI
jgi:altronate dehydratase